MIGGHQFTYFCSSMTSIIIAPDKNLRLHCFSYCGLHKRTHHFDELWQTKGRYFCVGGVCRTRLKRVAISIASSFSKFEYENKCFKSNNFLIGFAVCIFAFTNCDKVTHPIQSAGQNVDTVKLVRKVLVEDYTGHQCGAIALRPLCSHNDLETSYHEKVVPIAVREGFTPTSGEFLTSYNKYWQRLGWKCRFFNISAGAGNPNGMVNRKSFQVHWYGYFKMVQRGFQNRLITTRIFGFTLANLWSLNTHIKHFGEEQIQSLLYHTVNITMVLYWDSIVDHRKITPKPW